MEENPWKTLNSKVVYQNDWIRVREDQVVRPDGNEGIYGVVETKIAAGIVAVNEQREIYLVGQYRYTTNEYSWEIIEGGVEKNEDPLTGAQRELREEAGLNAQNWQRLGDDIHTSNCIMSEIGMLYLATGLEETENNPDGTEVLQVKKLPLTDAVQMAHSGEIKDSLSIIGILRADKIIAK